MATNSAGEHQPLLGNGNGEDEHEEEEIVTFEGEDDTDNPRQWPKSRKYLQVAVISTMALLSPLTSSVYAPAIDQIAEDFQTNKQIMIGAQTGFVVMLGLGPLILAPLSETFGRRPMYLICFLLFTLLQIPTALAPNIQSFIALRTCAGFFGSVGIANGGGSLSDLFESRKRASVLGVYLLAPLLGPTLGPVFGGIIVSQLDWRSMFWILAITSSCVWAMAYFLLHETYAPIILQTRKAELQKSKDGRGKSYQVEGEDNSPVMKRIFSASKRPLRILFTQPIVFIMSTYQAAIFVTMYSIYTNFQDIWQDEYGFSTLMTGLAYLMPATGFVVAAAFAIPFIDTIYNNLADQNDNDGQPEYRLPLANIGAVILPISLFWFAWTVEYRIHWFPTLFATFFFGSAQVIIFNTVQNYYIDSFEKFAASAIAAGAVMRSVVGGIVPLFMPGMFDALGYGWGLSIFGFVTLALMPAPLFFYYYGKAIREKFAIEL